MFFFSISCGTELKPQLEDAQRRIDEAKTKQLDVMEDLAAVQNNLNFTTSTHKCQLPIASGSCFTLVFTYTCNLYCVKTCRFWIVVLRKHLCVFLLHAWSHFWPNLLLKNTPWSSVFTPVCKHDLLNSTQLNCDTIHIFVIMHRNPKCIYLYASPYSKKNTFTPIFLW